MERPHESRRAHETHRQTIVRLVGRLSSRVGDSLNADYEQIEAEIGHITRVVGATYLSASANEAFCVTITAGDERPAQRWHLYMDAHHADARLQVSDVERVAWKVVAA